MALFAGGRGDLVHDVADASDRGDQFLHHLAGLIHQFGARADLIQRGVDQLANLPCRLRRAAGQLAHLLGDHRKAAAVLAGTRRLHRGVQRQDVGLEGDGVDGADDVGDPMRARADVVHGGDHALHHLTAAACGAARFVGQLAGLACVVGVLADGGGQLLHARGGLLQRGGLLFGTGGQVVVAAGDMLGTLVDQVAAVAYRAHGAGQPRLHLGQGGVETADLVVAALGNLLVQATGLHRLEVADQPPQRTNHVDRDTPQHATDGQGGDNQHGDDGPLQQPHVLEEGVVERGAVALGGDEEVHGCLVEGVAERDQAFTILGEGVGVALCQRRPLRDQPLVDQGAEGRFHRGDALGLFGAARQCHELGEGGLQGGQVVVEGSRRLDQRFALLGPHRVEQSGLDVA